MRLSLFLLSVFFSGFVVAQPLRLAPGVIALVLHQVEEQGQYETRKVASFIDDEGPPWRFDLHKAQGLDWFNLSRFYQYYMFFKAESAGHYKFYVTTSVPQLRVKKLFSDTRKVGTTTLKLRKRVLSINCTTSVVLNNDATKSAKQTPRYQYDPNIAVNTKKRLTSAVNINVAEPGFVLVGIMVGCKYIDTTRRGKYVAQLPMMEKDFDEFEVDLNIETPDGTYLGGTKLKDYLFYLLP